MAGKMWFGNRRYMQWVPCPQVGADYSSIGSLQSMDYLNGGAFRRRSVSAAKKRRLSWTTTKRDSIRAITDFADGIYGDGPIYWVDPFTMDKNVLSTSFAAPALAGSDGVSLVRGKRPSIVPTTGVLNGYPIDSAVYTIAAGQEFRKEFIPIPPGHTAWVGAHGDPLSTAGISVNYVLNGASQAAIDTVSITACDAPRFSQSYPASAFAGIELSLGGAVGQAATIAGIMVQVLPDGVTPEQVGPFISGQGMSGAAWEELPQLSAYSAALDMVGLTATFTEVEQWQ